MNISTFTSKRSKYAAGIWSTLLGTNCQCDNTVTKQYGGQIGRKRYVNHVQHFYLSTLIYCLSLPQPARKPRKKDKEEEWSYTTDTAGIWKITGTVKHSASYMLLSIYRRSSSLHVLRTAFPEHFYSFLFQGKLLDSCQSDCRRHKPEGRRLLSSMQPHCLLLKRMTPLNFLPPFPTLCIQ